MRTIPTTQGKSVTVDDSDFEWLSQYSWHFTNGYATATVGKRPNRRTLYMHRLIMGEPEGMDIDHINRVKLDNRRSNLRVCTRIENMNNQGVYQRYKTNKSGIAGVSFLARERKWRASFQYNGVRIYRSFLNKEDAVTMANKMRAEV